MSSKGKMWFQWIAIIIISFQFTGAAVAKLTGGMCEHFLGNGMTFGFMYFIGFLEATAVVGLFFHHYRIKSCLTLMIIMMGAILSHIPNDQVLMVLLNIANIGLLSIIIWAELEKRYMTDDMLHQEVRE